jgi:hypothetical protein
MARVFRVWLLSLFTLAGLCVATAAFAEDVTGTWIMSVETGAGSGTPTFKFTQQGESLSGSYSGLLGEAPVAGTIKGDEVSFEFTVGGSGQSLTVKYTGKVNGTSMSGRVSLGQLGEGTFTGRKQ